MISNVTAQIPYSSSDSNPFKTSGLRSFHNLPLLWFSYQLLTPVSKRVWTTKAPEKIAVTKAALLLNNENIFFDFIWFDFDYIEDTMRSEWQKVNGQPVVLDRTKLLLSFVYRIRMNRKDFSLANFFILIVQRKFFCSARTFAP